MIAIFLIVFAAMHGYLFVFLASGFGHPWIIGAALSLLCALPFGSRWLEKRSPSAFSRCLSVVGLTWMGAALIFVTVAAMVDLVFAFLPSTLAQQRPLLGIAIWVLATIWSAVEARRVRVKTIEISVGRRFGGGAKRTIRLLQISDLHLGSLLSERHVETIAKRIIDLAPDVVVSTGDLIDGRFGRIEPLLQRLRTIDPPLGKFAIVGNHEAYAGVEDCIRLTESAGFATLRNESVRIHGAITLIGIDDPAAENVSTQTDLASAALRSADPSTFRILLKHRPEAETSHAALFDLQLSGHTHGGQIFPFGLLAKLQYPARVGLSEIAGGALLYQSRGTGSWGPQLRFLAPPEITLFTLDFGETGEKCPA